MRKKIYSVIFHKDSRGWTGRIYEIIVSAAAVISIIPLMFKTWHPVFGTIDTFTLYVLFLDYILRWLVHDFRSKYKKPWAFLVYPFTPMAIVGLLCMLPSFGFLDQNFRILRMFRIFKVIQYTRIFNMVIRVFKRERKTLLSVLIIALGYIFISALAMFTNEPDTFNTFYDAIYWATTALTTVGYGDVYPVSNIGKLISMLSSLFGIAIIALPAGVVTAGFMEEINSAINDSELETQREPDEGLEKPEKKGSDEVGKRLTGALTYNRKRYAAIMLLCVAVNIVLSETMAHVNTPLWLDVTGTIAATIILEPGAGLIVGLVNNFFRAIFISDPTNLVYYGISAAVALIAAIMLDKDGHIGLKRVIVSIALMIAASTLLSGVLKYWQTGGVSEMYWEDYFFEAAAAAGFGTFASSLFGTFVVKIPDTIVSVILAVIIFKLVPEKYRGRA